MPHNATCMMQPIIDDPLEKPSVKTEQDRVQLWTMVTLGMAIALLGNNLRVLYDPFPVYFVDLNGFQIETDTGIHFLIFTFGMLFYARNTLQIQPNFSSFLAAWLSFASGFLAIVLFRSVDIFVTYSIQGIWQPLLRAAILMGAYCGVVSFLYFSIKKRGSLVIALAALAGWVVLSWVLNHFWKV